MNSWKHALGGVASFLLALWLHADSSVAASFAVRDGVAPGSGAGLERVFFHHSPRVISYYCYSRNYWWFYRPYTTATQDYARCMPYFHYPPQAYRGGDGTMK